MESVPIELLYEALGRKDFELFLSRRRADVAVGQLQESMTRAAELQRQVDHINSAVVDDD